MNNQTKNPRLTINGVTFAPIWGMSGVQNFGGEGWPHHDLLNLFGLAPDFTSVTFVAKTTTLEAREGNMPLDDKFMPKEFLPRCIHVNPFANRVLNAVSLSGPGLMHLLGTNMWRKRPDPFQISWMTVAEDPTEKLRETARFVEIISEKKRVGYFQTPFGIQDNESCPNTGGNHSVAKTADIIGRLDCLAKLQAIGIPIIIKFGLDTPPQVVKELEDHPAIDGICIPNTIKFNGADLPWKKWYPKGSPLVRRGFDPKFSGGLSGEPLRNLSLAWIRELRELGFKKHINGGGGILKPKHVDLFKEAGADSVSIGTVAITRPWRVQNIIRRAYQIYTDDN